MKKIFLFLITLFTTHYLFAENTTFVQANKYYNEGKYDNAISIYNQLLEGKKHAPELYFNLGNCYYKKGKLGSAILNYERAKILAPTDKEILDNLIFANAQIADKIEQKPQYFIVKWLRELIQSATSNQWAYLTCGVWFIFFILLFLFVHYRSITMRKVLFPLLIFTFFTSIFSGYATHSQYKKMKYNNQAIVFSSSTTVQSTPSFNGTALFVLHEGAKVKILEKVGTWYNIQLADEREGWIAEKDIQRI